MKNIPVKFRGKRPDGSLVFGDLSHDGDHVFINDRRVFPDSVSQLVGLDKNGLEVYDGDLLKDNLGNYFVAHLHAVALNDDSDARSIHSLFLI